MDGGLPELSSDRAITATSSEINSPGGGGGGGDTVVDSTSTGWTDEKHSLYLNSIEATFVSQLYSSEHRSKDLHYWLPRIQKHTGSSGSNANSLVSGQRRGCWKNLEFERSKGQVDIENQSRLLSENQWIRHFRSPSTGKEPHMIHSKKEQEPQTISSDQVDDNELASKSIHLPSLSHGREATSSKQLPIFFSHLYPQDSVGSNTEVSDQNFVDEDFGRRKKYKKRSRTAAADSPTTDQVVPSEKSLVEPSADDSLKGKDAECSSKRTRGQC